MKTVMPMKIIVYNMNKKGGVYAMSLAEKLIKDFEVLSVEKQMEVVDFVEFLKAKEKDGLYKRMDNILDQHAEAFRELAK